MEFARQSYDDSLFHVLVRFTNLSDLSATVISICVIRRLSISAIRFRPIH